MASEEHYPEDLHYHREHDWVRVEGEEAVFGITWYAQDSLGEVVYFEPPGEGQRVTAGEPYGELESVKAVSEVIAPLTGEIVAVNTTVQETPGLVNEQPYGDGWLIRVRLDDVGSVSDLMDATTYRSLVADL